MIYSRNGGEKNVLWPSFRMLYEKSLIKIIRVNLAHWNIAKACAKRSTIDEFNCLNFIRRNCDE